MSLELLAVPRRELAMRAKYGDAVPATEKKNGFNKQTRPVNGNHPAGRSSAPVGRSFIPLNTGYILFPQGVRSGFRPPTRPKPIGPQGKT